MCPPFSLDFYSIVSNLIRKVSLEVELLRNTQNIKENLLSSGIAKLSGEDEHKN